MTLEQLLELGLDEEIAKKVLEAHKEAIKDNYVPIARFNEVNEEKKELKIQLEERNKQLKDLKEKAEGNEELVARITELEELNKQTQKDYEEKIAALRKETAIELALKDAKARNIKAVKALLDLDKVSLDGDNLVGLEEQLKGLKESDPYLFGQDKLSGRDPKPPTEPVPDIYKKNPFSKEFFNLTEQGRIYRENPELAAKLKAAAEGK